MWPCTKVTVYRSKLSTPVRYFTTTATTVSAASGTTMTRSDTEDDIESEVTTDVESHRSTVVSTSTRLSKKKGAMNLELDSCHYIGIDAVKKLRMHYNVNKVGGVCRLIHLTL